MPEYALFLQTQREWKLHDIVTTVEAYKAFVDIAEDMIGRRLLGPAVLGYAAYELTSQSSKAGESVKISAKEAFNYIRLIQSHFALDDEQFTKLLNSDQLDDMLRAVQLNRMDQVTVMLYQDGILVRKTNK